MRYTNWCKVDAIKDRKQVISTVHQSVESFTVTSGQCDHKGGGGGGGGCGQRKLCSRPVR